MTTFVPDDGEGPSDVTRREREDAAMRAANVAGRHESGSRDPRQVEPKGVKRDDCASSNGKARGKETKPVFYSHERLAA